MSLQDCKPRKTVKKLEAKMNILDELQVTSAARARNLSILPNRLYQLFSGNRAMTADTALRLQR